MKETELLDALTKIQDWCLQVECRNCPLWSENVDCNCKLKIDNVTPDEWNLEIKRKMIF